MNAESITAPVFAAWAQEYRIRGWTDVFPLPVAEKHPPPTGYTGANGVTPTDNDLRAWMVNEPAANIGVRPPVGVIGIDVDSYSRKTGDVNLEQFMADHGLPGLPPTFMSSARHVEGRLSGIHWYRTIDDRRFVGQVCKDVEIIQHTHRYGVMPGSIHPTGDPYLWYTPAGVQAPPMFVPEVGQLPFLPFEWIEVLTRRGGPGSNLTGASVERLSNPQIDEWIAAADERYKGWDWSKNFERIVEKLHADTLDMTRHAAMLRAAAIVVADITKGQMPGEALHKLAAEMAELTELPPPHKEPKRWAGEKEQAYWAAVGGAIPRYDVGGEWRPEIEDEIGLLEVGAALASGLVGDEAAESVEPLELLETSGEAASSIRASNGGSPVPRQDPAQNHDRLVAFDAIMRQRAGDYRTGLGLAERSLEVFRSEGLAGVEAPSTKPVSDAERWDAWLQAGSMVEATRSLTADHDIVLLPHWIDDGWIPKSATTLIQGPSTVGKSACAIDMACRLALGVSWFGHFTEQTPVLYLAFESALSIRSRVVAWSQSEDGQALLAAVKRRNPELISDRGTPAQLMIANAQGIDLTEPGGQLAAQHIIEAAIEMKGGRLGVVVIDTFSQSVMGKENKTEDVGAFVHWCDRMVTEYGHLGLAIVIVHHTGKAVAMGEHGEARGNSALKAAASSELSLASVVIADGKEKVLTPGVSIRQLKPRDVPDDGLALHGMKRSVPLLHPDGKMVRNRAGKAETRVVFGPMSDAERLQIGGQALVRAETARAQKVDKLSEIILGMEWPDGKPPAKSAIKNCARKDHGMTLNNSNVPLLNEAITLAETKRATR